MTQTGGRQPRRDALENRARILDHAELRFAARGLDVSLHRLAEELGVGIGTLYRHFPTLDDLHVALHHRVSDLASERLSAVALIEGPWNRIVGYVDLVLEVMAEHPLARVLYARVMSTRPEHARPAVIPPALLTVADEGRQLGLLRPDIELSDITVLPYLLHELVALGPAGAVLVPRMRALLLESLRPEGFPHTPLPPGAVDAETLKRIAAEHGRG